MTELEDAKLKGSDLLDWQKEIKTFRFQTGLGVDLAGGFRLKKPQRN